MNWKWNGGRRSLAITLGLAVAAIAVVSILFFSLSNSWVQAKVLLVLGMYTIAIPLLEYGKNGRWLPAFSSLEDRLSLVGRVVGFVAGLALFLLAIGSCWAFGAGSWKPTMAGFVLGLYTTSFMFIRYGISGGWFGGVRSVHNV